MIGSVTHACMESHVLHGAVYRPNLEKLVDAANRIKILASTAIESRNALRMLGRT